jgi:hypothetical protein
MGMGMQRNRIESSHSDFTMENQNARLQSFGFTNTPMRSGRLHKKSLNLKPDCEEFRCSSPVSLNLAGGLIPLPGINNITEQNCTPEKESRPRVEVPSIFITEDPAPVAIPNPKFFLGGNCGQTSEDEDQEMLEKMLNYLEI